MASRVNKISITCEVYVEMEGVHAWTISYVPSDDDELVKLAQAKHEAMLIAEARSNPSDLVSI